MDYLYYCNIETDQELNNRISRRNIPSAPLQPQFSIRPISTKYAFLPIVDHRPQSNVPIIMTPTYNVENVFNPGNAQSPWSGFASNIHKESILRNQGFALQNNEQSVFVPSTNSELYNTPNLNKGNETQPYPGLFAEEMFNPFNPNTYDLGKDYFNNFTRQQLLSSEPCTKP